MKITSLFVITMLALSIGATGYKCVNNLPSVENSETVEKKRKKQSIQVALLLDTSNSMDGLIEQAKSRLWEIVNTLTTLRFNDVDPEIEIALYQYGNDGISPENQYVQQVLPLTNDLDLISEKLFGLRTNGGSEYCGAAINLAHQGLKWDSHPNGMKLIYIAGNESFAQGPIDFRKTVKGARAEGIYVHTILCGDRGAEEKSTWKEGAQIGNGEFFVINSDKQARYIKTPFDNEISDLNLRLNKTYYGYGQQGELKKQSQNREDTNANSISSSNYVNRTVSKSKKIYNNASWDLVDKYKEDNASIKKLDQKSLPQNLKGKTSDEIEAFIIIKTKERASIQKEIGEIAKKREAYIKTEQKKLGSEDDLGEAINSSILRIAKEKGYKIND